MEINPADNTSDFFDKSNPAVAGAAANSTEAINGPKAGGASYTMVKPENQQNPENGGGNPMTTVATTMAAASHSDDKVV